jgi:hypothetical protein
MKRRNKDGWSRVGCISSQLGEWKGVGMTAMDSMASGIAYWHGWKARTWRWLLRRALEAQLRR